MLILLFVLTFPQKTGITDHLGWEGWARNHKKILIFQKKRLFLYFKENRHCINCGFPQTLEIVVTFEIDCGPSEAKYAYFG